MTNALLTPADFASTVVAVPPIALDTRMEVSLSANLDLVRHIVRGGVSILLYGGNANLYNFCLKDYAKALEMMEAASAHAHVITSIGPDYGKLQDQAPLIARSSVRNVMLLPMTFPADSHGTSDAVRRIADRLGFGVILYLKRENYIRPEVVEKLVSSGEVRFVKYAIERPDPASDDYLDAVIAAVGKDKLASGMGETPIGDHIGRRNLATYTSGAVCIAPTAAMHLLKALRRGDPQAPQFAAPFLAFEQLRTELGGIQMLHSAVSASGIADMGPIFPMISLVKPRDMARVVEATHALIAQEQHATAAVI